MASRDDILGVSTTGFKPGDTFRMDCPNCSRRYGFELVPGRITSIKCPCGQWVGAGHTIVLFGMAEYLGKIFVIKPK